MWFKKHIWCIILIALVVLILVPVLITILAPSVSSEISADGLLGYIIQAVSAIGTILLAYGQYILGKPANGLGNRAIYQPAAS